MSVGHHQNSERNVFGKGQTDTVRQMSIPWGRSYDMFQRRRTGEDERITYWNLLRGKVSEGSDSDLVSVVFSKAKISCFKRALPKP